MKNKIFKIKSKLSPNCNGCIVKVLNWESATITVLKPTYRGGCSGGCQRWFLSREWRMGILKPVSKIEQLLYEK